MHKLLKPITYIYVVILALITFFGLLFALAGNRSINIPQLIGFVVVYIPMLAFLSSITYIKEQIEELKEQQAYFFKTQFDIEIAKIPTPKKKCLKRKTKKILMTFSSTVAKKITWLIFFYCSFLLHMIMVDS